jgi:hypothetical protein
MLCNSALIFQKTFGSLVRSSPTLRTQHRPTIFVLESRRAFSQDIKNRDLVKKDRSTSSNSNTIQDEISEQELLDKNLIKDPNPVRRHKITIGLSVAGLACNLVGNRTNQCISIEFLSVVLSLQDFMGYPSRCIQVLSSTPLELRTVS